MEDMRQLIIVRKDLKMSPGKVAAQVSHASNAFFSQMVRDATIISSTKEYDKLEITIRKDICEKWLRGIFTKTVCEARNKNHLLKVLEIAATLGLEEKKDYWLIKDNCKTELTPEEVDEFGVGRTLTCIGFRPLPDSISHQLSHKYHLYI